MLQTEFEFTLPCGYIDERGTLHRSGVMRRATAGDELEALSHPRTRASEAYMSVVALSRVIVRLGTLGALSPAQVERLFAADFAYLQERYLAINGGPQQLAETVCPTCGTRIMFDLQVAEPAP